MTPRIASHSHCVVLVLCSSYMVPLFFSFACLDPMIHTRAGLLSYSDDSGLATTGPRVLPWQWGSKRTSTVSREKARYVGEKFPRSTSSVLCEVDKQTQICDACIRTPLRSVSVDLITCVFHPCQT